MSNWIVPIKSRKELIDLALDQIEKETKFHIIKKEYNDSSEYSYYRTCDFYIKEIPGFRFAIWNINRPENQIELFDKERIKWLDSLELSYNTELIFFCQYERDLDKFKPSRSGFVTGIFRQEYISEPNPEEEEVEYFHIYDTVNVLNYMKKHYIKSVELAGAQIRYIWEFDRSFIKCLISFIDGWIYEWKYRWKERCKLNKAIRGSKKYMRKLTQFNYIIEDHGSCCYPRIEVILRRKDKIDIDKYEKEWDIIDKFDSKYSNILSCNWFQYDNDEHILDEETLEKDKKIRDRFYYHCNQWITRCDNYWEDDQKVIDYLVEEVPDLEEIINREKEEREERYGRKNKSDNN